MTNRSLERRIAHLERARIKRSPRARVFYMLQDAADDDIVGAFDSNNRIERQGDETIDALRSRACLELRDHAIFLAHREH